jgi:hypothetical protein
VADSVAIPARELSHNSPNVVPVESQWDGLVVCHGHDGIEQWDVDIQTPGPYFLHFQFASGEKRPVHLFVNDEKRPDRFLDNVPLNYWFRGGWRPVFSQELPLFPRQMVVGVIPGRPSRKKTSN